MTREQIAELRRWCKDTDNAASIEVEKVLDEREALLDALRPIVERLDGDRGFINPDGGAEMLFAARAAIAKAEAP